MTAATPNLTPPTSSKGLPRGAAYAVIALVALAGGWVVYRAATGQSLSFSSTLAVDEKPSEYYARVRQGWMANRAQRPPRNMFQNLLAAGESVRARPQARGGGFEAVGGQTLVTYLKTANATRLAADSLDTSLLPGDQHRLLLQVNRLHAAAGADLATRAKITPDQIEKLKGINALQRYTLSPDDEKKFTTLFEAWESAPTGEPKAAAAKALGDAVKDFESTHLADLKSQLQKRVETVKSVLDADQVKALGGR
jgi:hypothetical protein